MRYCASINFIIFLDRSDGFPSSAKVDISARKKESNTEGQKDREMEKRLLKGVPSIVQMALCEYQD